MRNPARERGGEPAAPEKAAPEKSEDDKLIDELMEKPTQKEKAQPENPGSGEERPFCPSGGKIPSVRAYLREQQQLRKGYF